CYMHGVIFNHMIFRYVILCRLISLLLIKILVQQPQSAVVVP
ncbi:hypothetical protein L246_07295, partial [Salmonella enterica subsp. enterica serovar Worthington str. BCH-5715]